MCEQFKLGGRIRAIYSDFASKIHQKHFRAKMPSPTNLPRTLADTSLRKQTTPHCCKFDFPSFFFPLHTHLSSPASVVRKILYDQLVDAPIVCTSTKANSHHNHCHTFRIQNICIWFSTRSNAYSKSPHSFDILTIPQVLASQNVQGRKSCRPKYRLQI